MKTLLSIILTISIISNQPIDYSLAKVQKRGGKYIFFSCEPAESYELAFDINFKGSDFNCDMNNLVLRANNAAMKIGNYDGIIASNNSKEIAINFKNDMDSLNLIAHADRISGVYIFFLSEPLNEYDEVFEFPIKMVSTCGVRPIYDKAVSIALNKSKKYSIPFDGIILDDEFEKNKAIKFK